MLDKLVSIGKILNFHGIHGEARVGYTAGKEEQLEGLTECFIEKDTKLVKLTPESVRFHKKIAIIKFKELNSVNEVVELKGALIKIPKAVIIENLGQDEFYIDDLVGLDVFDTAGNSLGKVSSIDNIRAQDLISVKTEDGEEHLVPFVRELVPEICLKERKIVVNNIPGLFEKS